MTTGERLKQLLKKGKYTQATFASDLGVSVDVVGNWCRGVTPINTDALPQMALLLGTTIDYILTGNSYEISSDEYRLIQAYRNANSDAKLVVDTTLKQFAPVLAQKKAT